MHAVNVILRLFQNTMSKNMWKGFICHQLKQIWRGKLWYWNVTTVSTLPITEIIWKYTHRLYMKVLWFSAMVVFHMYVHNVDLKFSILDSILRLSSILSSSFISGRDARSDNVPTLIQESRKFLMIPKQMKFQREPRKLMQPGMK